MFWRRFITIGFRSTLLLLVAVSTIALPESVYAQGSTNNAVVAQETTIKAAYLYSFGRYVTWPKRTFESETAPFAIGVLGDHPILDSLKAIAKRKRIGGRRIVIRKITDIDQDLDVQILFVPGNIEAEPQFKAVNRLKNQSILLVGETVGFVKRGGTINSTLQTNSIRMRINVDSAKRQDLMIDAKLLNIATLVRDN